MVSIPSRSGYRQNGLFTHVIRRMKSLNPFKIRVPSEYRSARNRTAGNVSIPSRSGYRQNRPAPSKLQTTCLNPFKIRVPSECQEALLCAPSRSQSLQDQGTVRISTACFSVCNAMSQSLQDQGTVRISLCRRNWCARKSQSLQDQGTVRMTLTRFGVTSKGLNPFKIRVPSEL